MPNGWEKLIGQTITDIRGNGNEVSFYNAKGETILIAFRSNPLFDGKGMIFDFDSLPTGKPDSEDEVNRKIILDTLANLKPGLTITPEMKIADLGFDADDWGDFLEIVEGSMDEDVEGSIDIMETLAHYPIVDLEAFETVHDLVEDFVGLLSTTVVEEEDTDEDEDESED